MAHGECVSISRALNKIIVKNRCPLPHIDDLLNQLNNVVYCTKLDLCSGYHQIRVAEYDAWKTTFKTKQGLFERLVMLFGICNSLETFMHVMNDVFRPFLDDFVIVYLDEILSFSRTWDEHVRHAKKVLDTLQRENFYVKFSKCVFGKTALVYLGHIVGGVQLKIDPSRIDVIVNWPEPKSVTEIQRFLGAVQYWRKFISYFSFIVSPLHALTGVKKTFQWGGKKQKSFNTLKEKNNTTPVLAPLNLQQPFDIKTYANRYSMGAILVQYHRPICYHSKTFNQMLLTILHMIKSCMHYFKA
jgi:hypothetical protein